MWCNQNIVYIFTMLECIEKCWIYTANFKNADEFVQANDQKELNAVISLFIAIGEESKKIEQALKQKISTQIKWADIAGIRDKISHDYRGVDEDILWAVINNDLHQLKKVLIKMFQLINPDKKILNKILQDPYYKHLSYLKNV